jgi:HD domain
MATAKTMSERADELEREEMEKLDRVACKSVLFNAADGKIELGFGEPGKHVLMGDDPRLPKMPEKPTLQDFIKYRCASATNHLLQSAALARRNGGDEKLVLACLLHDLAVAGFIRADHGWWGAQLIEPYVDEEVSWAIRHHQALRFFPDSSVGYEYPEMYVRLFGEGYRPEPYIYEAYERARAHKWYMTARMICVNDLYSFDPDAVVTLEEFDDVIGRNFKQPEEGLGYDNSPVAHMWRTMIHPANAL